MSQHINEMSAADRVEILITMNFKVTDSFADEALCSTGV
jgi:hypothetical protein